MKQAAVQAHAKINLTLDVTGRRDNGYHDVCMVMQSIGLHDVVTIQTGTGTGEIALELSRGDLSTDAGNLAYRAASLFFEHTQTVCDGIAVSIQKNIPIAAGLAGGSTNAAAVLVLLDALYETHLGQDALMALGLKLGADVPFCIAGGTMLAQGIGEQLTRLPDAPQTQVLLCRPPVAVSTPAIYRAIDAVDIAVRPDTDGMIRALGADVHAVAQRLCNVMQPVTASMHPEVDTICQTMCQFGAAGAIMSGSGPTCFGLFDCDARTAYDALRAQYEETYLTDFCTAGQVRI